MSYILRDEFTTARLAGFVNGTAAEPGPGGNRTVVDTSNHVTIASGKLTFDGGKSLAYSDPLLRYDVLTRSAGLIIIQQVTFTGGGYGGMGGSTATSPSNTTENGGFEWNGATDLSVRREGSNQNNPVATIASATSYIVATAYRANGIFLFIKGGAFTYWTLLQISPTGNTANQYPFYATYTTALTSEYIHVPNVSWLPTPLASDGFGSTFGALDGLGQAETSGPGSGGGGGTWTTKAGTWGTAGGVASASATTGGVAIATVDVGKADVYAVIVPAVSAGGAGLVLRYIDTSNYLYAIHDGTNVKLVQVKAGTPSTLITSARAYSAGAQVMCTLQGTAARLWYNQIMVGTGTADAAFSSVTLMGLYSNNTTDTLDNFCVYPRGTGNEYSYLDTDFGMVPARPIDFYAGILAPNYGDGLGGVF